MNICKLPGCGKPCKKDYCGRTHANQDKAKKGQRGKQRALPPKKSGKKGFRYL